MKIRINFIADKEHNFEELVEDAQIIIDRFVNMGLDCTGNIKYEHQINSGFILKKGKLK